MVFFRRERDQRIDEAQITFRIHLQGTHLNERVVTFHASKTQKSAELIGDFSTWYLVDSLHDVDALGNDVFWKKKRLCCLLVPRSGKSLLFDGVLRDPQGGISR